MSIIDYEVPQQWILDLKRGVESELCDMYVEKAHWSYDDENLYLTFPDIRLDNLDFDKGITRAQSKYNGMIRQTPETKIAQLIFPKPKPNPPTTTTEVAQVTGVGESKIQSYQTPTQGERNTTTPSEVKQNMSINVRKHAESNSNWVSESNSKIGDIFKILAKPYYKESQFEGKITQQMVCDVCKESNETAMIMKINKNNCRKLINIFGAGPNEDGEPWVNRRVRIDDFKPEQKGKSLVLSPL